MIKTLTAKKNSILPFGVLISKFLSYKEVPKKSNDATQKIWNPINARTLCAIDCSRSSCSSRWWSSKEEAAPAAQVQGEQLAPHDRIDQLAAQMQGLTTHIDARFDAIDATLAAIPAQLGPQWLVPFTCFWKCVVCWWFYLGCLSWTWVLFFMLWSLLVLNLDIITLCSSVYMLQFIFLTLSIHNKKGEQS